MNRSIALIAFFAGMIGNASALAERPELLELQIGGTTWQGQAVANNDREFWLLARDGRLHKLEIARVSKFRTIAPRFQPLRAAELRTQLRKEFGRAFEVVGTSHYLVVATPGTGRKIADLLEQNYRTFLTQFNARGFRLDTPKFPLVAVVFPSQEEFAAYAKQDGVPLSHGTLGYYHLTSNRVALFEQTSGTLGQADPARKTARENLHYARVSGLNPTLEDTIVHEGIHQVAFNTGVHSRIGQNPRWVVEGLATVMEPEGMRNRTGQRGAKSRINKERLTNFTDYASKRRKRRTLAAFVAEDAAFGSSVVDGYAEAWALSYFLMETRSKKYSHYLKLLSERDPLKPYADRDRLADFQKAFGKDPDKLEVEFLRYMTELGRIAAVDPTGKPFTAAVGWQNAISPQASPSQSCRRCPR